MGWHIETILNHCKGGVYVQGDKGELRNSGKASGRDPQEDGQSGAVYHGHTYAAHGQVRECGVQVC